VKFVTLRASFGFAVPLEDAYEVHVGEVKTVPILVHIGGAI
jgi:hypothetical protein